jgi:hypothetical protein
METYTLTHTGDRPVRFEGDMIAQTNSKGNGGPCESRWYELALYQKQDGEYVLHTAYRTNWDGEVDIHRVATCIDPDEVAECLRSTSPKNDVVGYPLGKQYEDRQARMMRQMDVALRNAISNLLETLPEDI